MKVEVEVEEEVEVSGKWKWKWNHSCTGTGTGAARPRHGQLRGKVSGTDDVTSHQHTITYITASMHAYIQQTQVTQFRALV